MKVVVSVDLGTTGNRVMAFSKSGEILGRSYYEFPQIYPQPGWVEHDAKQIWDTALKSLREVTTKVGVENIQAVGITNQRETTILWDRKSGRPVSNAIVWQDRRTAGMCRELKPHEAEVKGMTGLFIDPYFSATKIRWIMENIEGVESKIRKGEIIFGTVDTWILWNLTRGKIHATDPGNASRTLLYNIKTLRYDEKLLSLFNVPESLLPEVRDSGGSYGAIDKELLGREIPITAVLGDQQASLYAQGGWQEGVVKNTYGTGLFVMTATGSEIPHSGRLLNTIAWKTASKTVYALEGSIFIGGAGIQWLRDGLKIIKSADETEALAESLSGNEGVYFVPALAGLGAPYWDPTARGMIIGLTRGTEPRHIARAALESLAYQTRDVIEEMKSIMPQKTFKTLRVDGGAVANKFLMQFQADILGFDVEQPAHTETTAFGAAGLAGVTCGFWSESDLLAIQKSGKVYHPMMKNDLSRDLYTRWKKAVEKALKWES